MWWYADDTGTRFYQDGGKYKDSPDEKYLKTLFINNSDNHNSMAKQLPNFSHRKLLAVAGHSSSGHMASRYIEEVYSGHLNDAPKPITAIIWSAGSYLCYNSPVCEKKWGKPDNSTWNIGCSFGNSRLNTSIQKTDKNYQFVQDCNKWAKTHQIGALNTDARNLQSCGNTCTIPSIGCCPAKYTEQTFEEGNTQWENHPPTLLIGFSSDADADVYGSYFYAKRLSDHYVESAVLECPGDGHGCFVPQIIDLCVKWILAFKNKNKKEAFISWINDDAKESSMLTFNTPLDHLSPPTPPHGKKISIGLLVGLVSLIVCMFLLIYLIFRYYRS